MSKNILYLVGQITADRRTYEWRDKVVAFFRGAFNVKVINPCSSLFNQEALASKNTDGNSFSKEALDEKGIALLPYKDKHYVDIANYIFADLNIYSLDKPIIGSFFELAWAFNDSSKMVIGIFDGDPSEDFICNHPFIKQTIQVWTKTHLEACELLERYLDY